jgi:nitrite reductase/ring-hydroxylating ferredoxin subunit
MSKQKIGSTSDVQEGKGKQYMVNGQSIAVFHVNGKWFAIGDKCTHRGGPLHQGEVEGTVVTCPWHAGQFDITSGQNLSPPAPSKSQTYKISAEGNELFLDI